MKTVKRYVIKNIYTGSYWSNELGWCDLELADRFTGTERQTLDKPLDGEWKEEPQEKPE